ncbi:MAG: DUF1501 domain-containing protein [Acidobacteria bacterium]|nr:DUF1501 domain-containing protein [Acidobacteriota bacterium]
MRLQPPTGRQSAAVSNNCIVKVPVYIHEPQVTILHCLGIDHTKLTYKFQGRHFRLTDIAREVIQKTLA